VEHPLGLVSLAWQTMSLDLSSIALFRGISDSALAHISQDMLHYYSTGQVIVREGEPAGKLVVIIRGSARVTLQDTLIVIRQAGSVVGEQALIDRVPRSATVTAEGMVECLEIPESTFDQLLSDPTFSRNLLQILSSKLSEATRDRSFRYRNEERLFAEFRAHVAPEIADRLLANAVDYSKPRYIDAIILMADVRSFTETSSHMAPEDIAKDLGPYLDSVVDIIHRHNGFVDKFIGDAVLAVWGITSTDEKDASKAFLCAQEMVRQASTMSFGGKLIRIGVGLNHGRVFVGNVGGTGKKQFTVLGTPVNLTQRYESQTKDLAVEIIAGNDFFLLLDAARRAGWKEYRREIKGAGEQIVHAFSCLDWGPTSD